MDRSRRTSWTTPSPTKVLVFLKNGQALKSLNGGKGFKFIFVYRKVTCSAGGRMDFSEQQWK